MFQIDPQLIHRCIVHWDVFLAGIVAGIIMLILQKIGLLKSVLPPLLFIGGLAVVGTKYLGLDLGSIISQGMGYINMILFLDYLETRILKWYTFSFVTVKNT